MTNDYLENLVKIGELKIDPSTDDEIEALIQRGMLRIKDFKHPKLSIETRFDIAYGAAHALCLAALKNLGYRSESRYIVFQCAQHTIGLEPEHWRVMSDAHRHRNIAEYEGHIEVNEQLLEALARVVDIVAERVKGVVRR